MPVGAYILARVTHGGQVEGWRSVKSGPGLTIQSRKNVTKKAPEGSKTTGCNELPEEAGPCRTDRRGTPSLLPFMPANIPDSK